MRKSRRLATVLVGMMAAFAVTAGTAGAAEEPSVAIPGGMTASFLSVNLDSGKKLGHDEHKRFRSASLVKLYIALDYLESLDGKPIPPEDKALLEPMLRSSDDDAASTLWVRQGWEQIIVRAVAKIGLTDTAPPAERGMWGYTAISAADIVKTYDYILNKTAAPVRDFIIGNLHQSTKCGTDTFNQTFGIPSAVPRPWGVKQGWSGFGDKPAPGEECVEHKPMPRTLGMAAASASAPGERADAADGGEIDLKNAAMHTSGTIGKGDRRIMVVLTLEPKGTAWKTSANRITELTRAVNLASQVG